MKILRTLATMTAFALGAIVLSAAFCTLHATGHAVVPGPGVDDMLEQCAFIVAYALLAGLMIDAVRWLNAVTLRPAARRHGSQAVTHRPDRSCLAD